MDKSWAVVKRSQADDADRLAAVASGIGQYGISNSCYKLAAMLREEADQIILEAERLTAALASGSVQSEQHDNPNER